MESKKKVKSPKAVKAYAEPNIEEGNVKTSIGLGTDSWDCGGYKLTPAMRQEVLLELIAMYLEWKEGGCSYEWDLSRDPTYGEFVPIEQQDVETVEEFLPELTGWSPDDEPGWPLNYDEHLEEWLDDYLRVEWGLGFDAKRRPKPIRAALDRVLEWLDPLSLADLLAWRQTAAEAA